MPLPDYTTRQPAIRSARSILGLGDASGTTGTTGTGPGAPGFYGTTWSPHPAGRGGQGELQYWLALQARGVALPPAILQQIQSSQQWWTGRYAPMSGAPGIPPVTAAPPTAGHLPGSTGPESTAIGYRVPSNRQTG